MALIDGSRRFIALAAFLGVSIGLSGCGISDVQIDAPILDAAGIHLTSKKADDENVPERPGIVIPPSTESLPEPGTRTAAAQQNWPQDPEQIKARKAKEDAEAYEKYCREGKWDGNGSITDFEKDLGIQQRCPSKLGEAISKSLGGGDGEDEEKKQ